MFAESFERKMDIQEPIIDLPRKRRFRWLVWLLASPFILFALLCVLLYLPPIQNFVVDKVAGIASESTGLNISVGRITLSFPLDLVVKEVQAVNPERGDTLLDLKRMEVSVQMLPLLKKEIEIDGISLVDAEIHTGDFIEGIGIDGHLGQLFLESHGVVLDPEKAVVNEFTVKDADFRICLNDTTETPDTTATDTLYWKFDVREVALENVKVALDMPLDSLSLVASLQKTDLRRGYVDLHANSYAVQSFSIEEGAFAMDTTINLQSIDLQVDSVYYCGRDVRAVVSRFDLLEKVTGLELVSTFAKVVADNRQINLPQFSVKTTSSYVDMSASVDWEMLDMNPSSALAATLNADFSKRDIALLTGTWADSTFIEHYPDSPFELRADVGGTLNHLRLNTFSAALQDALDIHVGGELRYLTDSLRRGGDFQLSALAKNLSFLPAMTGGVAVPEGTFLQGNAWLEGSQIKAGLLLEQPDTLRAVQDTLVILDARYHLNDETYFADLHIDELDVHRFLPQDSIFGITASLRAEGQGFDFFSRRTRMEAQGRIDKVHYANYHLTGYDLSASLHEHQLDASLIADNSAMNIRARLDGHLKPNDIAARLRMDVANLDWQAMHLMDKPLSTSHQFDFAFLTDLEKRYELDASMVNTTVKAPKRTFKTRDLFLGFTTSIDSTTAYMRAGDLDMDLNAKGYVEELMKQADVLMNTVSEQWQTKTIDQQILKNLLPDMALKVTSGKDNPICNYLSFLGFTYDYLYMDVTASPEKGLNGENHIYGMHNDSLALDTIYLDMQHDTLGINYQMGVSSGPKKKQEAFEVMLDGFVRNGSAQLLVDYLNAEKETGVHLGLNAELRRRGIRLRFFPEHPTLLYRPFNLNERNYIYLSDRGRIFADVRLYDEQGTGLGFYTNREDTLAQQDMTVELSRINLQEFRRIMPYMPDMEGWLGGEVHYVDKDRQVMFSGDLQVDDFIYEKTGLGSWEMNGVYLPGSDFTTHHVDGFIQHNGKEVAHVGGLYRSGEVGNEDVEADMDLTDFPLYVINPFVPDKMVEFTGTMKGALTMTGTPVKPVFNGGLGMDSVVMTLPDMSLQFRFDDKMVQMVNSRMTFKDFNIYTKGKSPFAINGYVDMSNLENMSMDLRMRANDYELLNAQKNRRSVMYGKIYVDVDATLRGKMDELQMRGNMNVLGKTDFTYILKESPLTVTDRLGDMVTFVNFNDTTTVEEPEEKVALNGIDIAMTIHIDQAVQAHVDLTPDASNYMFFEGGGDLAFQYTPQGQMLLNGRYSLMSGELKYQIPVIPLKTFNIQNGSYVEWTGNVMNPTLGIKATERVRATVGENGQTPRMVSFDVGIDLSERLENLGLAFTLEAPEDASVQEQLSAMSAEERNKLAVTMLVTGMYMAEGNSTGGFNVNNALNSYLQSQISDIAGKTLDVSVGMETMDNADGVGKRTDYNFQFAKRFWNNRFRIVIGGKVSTGNTAQQDETFIDNVSVEYRLDNSGTRYVKLFHDKNYESVLEGEVIETGIGVVLRKKMSKLGELFIFKRKDDNE